MLHYLKFRYFEIQYGNNREWCETAKRIGEQSRACHTDTRPITRKLFSRQISEYDSRKGHSSLELGRLKKVGGRGAIVRNLIRKKIRCPFAATIFLSLNIGFEDQHDIERLEGDCPSSDCGRFLGYRVVQNTTKDAYGAYLYSL